MSQDAQHDAEVLAGLDFEPSCSTKNCSVEATFVLVHGCCGQRTLFCPAHRVEADLTMDRVVAQRKVLVCEGCHAPTRTTRWQPLPAWKAPGPSGAS